MTASKKQDGDSAHDIRHTIYDSSKLQAELDLLKEQVDNLTNQLKRSQADFINFKKRVERDQEQFIHAAYGDVIISILPVVDSMQRIAEHLPKALEQDEWAKGVLHAVRQMEEVLRSLGVAVVEAVGEKPNPEVHEIVAEGPGEKNMIIDELERGYTFRGRAIRPAKVRVGDGST